MNLLETRIDRDAIAWNTHKVAQLAGKAQCMCVVKANGYNHGAVEVAKVMKHNGADQFGVATLAEAQQLRAGGIDLPILTWLWSTEEDYRSALAQNIQVAICNWDQAKAIRTYAEEKPVHVTVKIDTGMHRTGLPWQETPQVLEYLRHPNVHVTGLMSHLASADFPTGEEYTRQQIAHFRESIRLGKNLDFELPINHLANSAGLVSYPEAHFEMVRPGVALYGLEPVPEQPQGFRPAMQWVSHVTNVKKLSKGEGVSYGLTWTAAEDSHIAVVAGGYADGVARAAQEKIEVAIGPRRYPQVGRVCMDQFMVNLGANEDQVQVGDEVTIFGGDAISATEIAQRLGTIHYEVVCSPKGRTHRVYTGRGERNKAEIREQ